MRNPAGGRPAWISIRKPNLGSACQGQYGGDAPPEQSEVHAYDVPVLLVPEGAPDDTLVVQRQFNRHRVLGVALPGVDLETHPPRSPSRRTRLEDARRDDLRVTVD
jgi:hypothetical protein